MSDDRSADVVADKILASWDARCAKAAAYNERLAKGEIKPGLRAIWWTIKGKREEREKSWREKDGRRKPVSF
jgi:hypothetical protein